MRTGQPSKREIKLERELKLVREEREKDRLARQELEKKIASLQKGKASSKSSSSAAETKGEDSSASNGNSTCRVNGGGSVKARYHQLKDVADEMATVDELARLKKENLLMKRAMDEE